MEREKFKSRLGFILISAGCAIGIGNVWRFPYVVGNNGGGCFVLFYVLFLVILGLPILTMEFSVGRASQQSIARAFTTLEKKGQFWHLHGYIGMAGNYILMMFYTTVAGWMLKYFFDTAKGDFIGATTSQVKDHFTDMNSVPSEMIFWKRVRKSYWRKNLIMSMTRKQSKLLIKALEKSDMWRTAPILLLVSR